MGVGLSRRVIEQLGWLRQGLHVSLTAASSMYRLRWEYGWQSTEVLRLKGTFEQRPGGTLVLAGSLRARGSDDRTAVVIKCAKCQETVRLKIIRNFIIHTLPPASERFACRDR